MSTESGRARKAYPFFRGRVQPPTSFYDLTVPEIKTSNYTTEFDELVRVNPVGGPFTITLPSVDSKIGKTVIIKNVTDSNNVVTISTSSGELIDGLSSYLIDSSYETVMFFSDGTNWQIGYRAGPQAETPAAAGISSQIQFNDAGSLSANSGFTYNKLNSSLVIGGDITINGGDLITSASIAGLFNENAGQVNIGNEASYITLGNVNGITTVRNSLQVTGSTYVTGVLGFGAPTTSTSYLLANNVAGDVKLLETSTGNVKLAETSTNLLLGGASSVLTLSGSYLKIDSNKIRGSLSSNDVIEISGDSVSLGVNTNQNVNIKSGLQIAGSAYVTGSVGIGSPTAGVSVGLKSNNITGDVSLFDTTTGDIILGNASSSSPITLRGGYLKLASNKIRGNSSTGDVITVSSSSPYNDITLAGKLTVSGGEIISTSTASLLDTVSTTINFGGVATNIDIGSSIGNTTVKNSLQLVGTAYVTGSIKVGPNSGATTIAARSDASAVNLFSTTNGNIQIGDDADITLGGVSNSKTTTLNGGKVKFTNNAICGSDDVESIKLSSSGTGNVYISGSLYLGNLDYGGGSEIWFYAKGNSPIDIEAYDTPLVASTVANLFTNNKISTVNIGGADSGNEVVTKSPTLKVGGNIIFDKSGTVSLASNVATQLDLGTNTVYGSDGNTISQVSIGKANSGATTINSTSLKLQGDVEFQGSAATAIDLYSKSKTTFNIGTSNVASDTITKIVLGKSSGISYVNSDLSFGRALYINDSNGTQSTTNMGSTNPYSVIDSDYVLFSSNAITVTLPSTSSNSGRVLIISNISTTNSLTVTLNASDISSSRRINRTGNTSITLGPEVTKTFICRGTSSNPEWIAI